MFQTIQMGITRVTKKAVHRRKAGTPPRLRARLCMANAAKINALITNSMLAIYMGAKYTFFGATSLSFGHPGQYNPSASEACYPPSY